MRSWRTFACWANPADNCHPLMVTHKSLYGVSDHPVCGDAAATPPHEEGNCTHDVLVYSGSL